MPAKNAQLQWTSLIQHFQKVGHVALTGDYEKLANCVAEAVHNLTDAYVFRRVADCAKNT